MQGVVIRRFEPRDRQALRDIAWQTAFMGQDASAFFEDKEVFCDFLTLYFTDFEPRSSFVAASGGRVVGYLTGALDERVLGRIFTLKILIRLIWRAFIRGTFFKLKNFYFLAGLARECFKGGYKTPDFFAQYPAVLHINLDSSAQRMGMGSMLISSFFRYLQENGVKGVHLTSMSDKGINFFKKQGFSVLYEGRRSYFEYLLGRQVPFVVFGKKIPQEK